MNDEKKAGEWAVPKWKPDRFAGIKGIMDRLMKKNRLLQNKTVQGAYFERCRRELECYETNVLIALEKAVCSDLEAYRALAPAAESALPSPALPDAAKNTTTGQKRRARAQQQAAEERRAKVTGARAQRAALAASICRKAGQAEQQIELAARELNLQLVKYSKSGYFTVVEEEVPKVAKTFSADEFIKRMGVKEE